MSFLNYYKKEIEKAGGYEKYVNIKAKEKKLLLDRVIKYSQATGRILEAGCGSGANSIFLANRGLDVTCIDIDDKILKFASDSSKLFAVQPKFKKRNLLKLDYPKGYFDVVFSHGVLEHFSDKDIIKIVNKELSVSKYVIISVPSDFFKVKDAIRGDERFLPRKYWKELLAKVRGTTIDGFGYFYHSNSFVLKLMEARHKVGFGIIFRKTPYMGFVIRSID